MNNQFRYLCVLMLVHHSFIISMYYRPPKKPEGLSAQQSAHWDFFNDRCQLVFKSEGMPIVQNFFDAGNSVATVSDEGTTVLEHAYNNYNHLTQLPPIQQDPMWLFTYLFASGANPHIHYEKDHKVMLRASKEKKTPVVVAFIKAGADKDYTNPAGENIFTHYTTTPWDIDDKISIEEAIEEKMLENNSKRYLK